MNNYENEKYVNDYYKKTKDSYSKFFLNFVNNINKENTNNKNNITILDFGSGLGKESYYLKNLGYKVISVDKSLIMRKKSLEFYNIKTLENLKTIKDNSINYFYCSAVLQHLTIEELYELFKELKRILIKDTELYISIKNISEEFDENNNWCNQLSEYDYSKIIFKSNFKLLNSYIDNNDLLKRKKISWINMNIKNEIPNSLDKYKVLYKINNKVFAGFDFDGTLGITENANTYIKRLIKDKKKLIKDDNKLRIIIDDNRNIEDIKISETTLIIEKIENKNLLQDIKLENNEIIELTKKFKNGEDFANFFFNNNIKEEFNLQITEILNNEKKYLTYYKIDKDNINLNSEYKIDYRFSNLNDLNDFYQETDEIKKIKKIKDFKDFDINYLNNKNIKITTKIVTTYEKIMNNDIKYDTIEKIIKLTPVTYNQYKKMNQDLVPNYKDFRSAELLKNNTIIFDNVKKEIIKHFKKGHLTTIITARNKMKNNFGNGTTKEGKEIIKNYFNNIGLEIGHMNENKIHIFFNTKNTINSNNLNLDLDYKISNKFLNKMVVIEKINLINNFLKEGKIKEFYFYEDNLDMLDGLKDFFKKNYSNIKNKLFYVDKGKIINYDKFIKNKKFKEIIKN